MDDLSSPLGKTFKENFVKNPLYEMRQNYVKSSPLGDKSEMHENRFGDFWQIPIYEVVNIDALIQTLEVGIKDKTYFFNKQDFKDWGSPTIEPDYSNRSSSEILYYHYSHEGIDKKGDVRVLLNSRISSLDSNFGYNIKVDPANHFIVFQIHIFYSETKEHRRDITSTLTESDFNINEKYTAVQINTNDPLIFEDILTRLGGSPTIRSKIKNAYDIAFNSLKFVADINWFYSKAPQYVIQDIGKVLLWIHLLQLLKYDSEGWWSWLKDSSNAMINVITAITNKKNGKKFLFAKFNENPVEVKKIYDVLGSSSTFEGEEMANKTIFATLLTAICDANLDEILVNPPLKAGKWGERDRTDITFKLTEGYKVDSNILSADNEPGKYNLTQQFLVKTTFTDTPVFIGLEEGGGKADDTVEYYSSYNHPTHVLHPLDMVQVELDGPYGQLLTLTVPAIFVKDIAHQTEWASVMKIIRLAVNLLMIIVSVATIASGAGLLLTSLAWIDLGLAIGDITVQAFEDELRKTEWGRKFLKIWDAVYTIGGFATAAPLLGNLIYNGVKALARVTTKEARAKLTGMLKAAIIQSKNFPKGVIGRFNIVTNFVDELASLAIDLEVLLLEGVLLVQSWVKSGKDLATKYYLVFQDTIIFTVDSIKVLKQEVKQFMFYKHFLDDLAHYKISIKRSPFSVPMLSFPSFKSNERLYKLYLEGLEIFSGSRNGTKEFIEKLKKISDLEAKKFLEDLIHSYGKSLSSNATKELKQLLDETWLELQKMPTRKRKGAVCVLEHPYLGIFRGKSIKGLKRGVLPDWIHPALHDWLKNMQNTADVINQHGKCAEVDALSKLLWQIDPKGLKNLEEFSEILDGTVSRALELSKNVEIHGAYKEACPSCSPMLGVFNIAEDIF